ncbi:MAG: gliding motility-associated C-terminal domain-containing protein [Sphingobacteriaceae bacterium]|nr:MAG: gliding motility-associated C-terminal domain-containing protein [Sphingobacteriaceae bacterium]
MHFIKFLCAKRSIAAVTFLGATYIAADYSFGDIPKLSTRISVVKSVRKRKSSQLNYKIKLNPDASAKQSDRADFASTQKNEIIEENQQEPQSPTLAFGAQNINTKSAAQFFTIRGSKLTADVTVRTNPPFVISKDSSSIDYEPLLIYTIAELESNQTVYVKFNPTKRGNYADSIISISEGADNKIVNLSGTAVAAHRMMYGNRLAANNIISPNGDGINDTWIIKNIEDYPNNSVKLMDKAGKVIYSKQGYANDWDGTYNNAPLAQGTYYYIVDFGADSGLFFRGFITIVRD